MSEKVDELKEMEKKKLDAAFETYNGNGKEAEMTETVPPEIDAPPARREREGTGDPNLGVLLVVAGILLFLVFSGFSVRFGFWGWMIAGWLIFMVVNKKGRGCRW